MNPINEINRREMLGKTLAASTMLAASNTLSASAADADDMPFRLRYLLASAMYGYADVKQVLPEVRKSGAEAIDLWPKVHGNQREQIDKIGHQQFRELLKRHRIRLGGIACYRLGPFGLREEMKIAAEIGGRGVVLVCGARGPRDAKGTELKKAVAAFIEQLKPHVAVAEETGCVIAVENHSNSLIQSPDSMRWFGEMATSKQLGVALAPHHLPQDAELIAGIARDLGDKVKFFYAQQHGMGSSKKLPKEQELLQMPGRGPLDFTPILAALKKVNYGGYTEIFMHPVPRGVPILASNEAITKEINRSRDYLEACLKKTS